MTSVNYQELARLARLGRRAEKRGKAIEGCVTYLLIALFAYLFRGWMLMLAVGIVHNDWVPSLPPLGYWLAVLLVALLSGVFSAIRPDGLQRGEPS